MNDSLEQRVGALLRERGMSIALAESCTGGLIAHQLTNVAGSSAYLRGGVVSYSNEAKHDILGVQASTLETYGAVSEQTAYEMAHGARRLFDSDVALSVTGIAGPGGASDEKPVGLTYVGLVTRAHEQVQRFVWNHDRIGNKYASADAALRLLLNYLEAR